jgi:hypothetical protein
VNEAELKHAFTEIVAAERPPLSLDAAAMLDRARQARRRRRAGLTTGLATGTSVLAAASVAGAVALLPLGGSGGGAGAGRSVGGSASCTPQPTGGAPTGPALPTGTPSPGLPLTGTDRPTGTALPRPTVLPTPPPLTVCPAPGGDTERPWPSGQSDRTARSGPHAQRAERVLAALVGALPAGYRSTSPYEQAQFEDWDTGDSEVWEYLAMTGATKSGRTGLLQANVTTPSSRASADLCMLARFYDRYDRPAPGCHTVVAGGKRVAVAGRVATGAEVDYPSASLDQWAVYRHPDGTVVRVGQVREYAGHGKGLQSSVLTEQQLASLATSPAFVS